MKLFQHIEYAVFGGKDNPIQTGNAWDEIIKGPEI